MMLNDSFGFIYIYMLEIKYVSHDKLQRIFIIIINCIVYFYIFLYLVIVFPRRRLEV